MFNIMGKLKEVSDQMQKIQKELEAIEVVGEGGAGLVQAIANGKRRLVRLQIDKEVLANPKAVLEDLVVSAVNAALQKAEEVHKEKIQESTRDLLPNIPGIDLGNFT